MQGHLSLPASPEWSGRSEEALSTEIAETRMRYGDRRVHVVLQREGWMINVKRTYCLDSELISASVERPLAFALAF
jgi:hypothetical protein